jgi:predicted O-methyltransferase YrrM
MITPTPEFLKALKETNGALSIAESIFIMQAAALAPKGTYIELGVAYGKSAMSACTTLNEGFFYLVDPLFEDAKVLDEVYNKVSKINPDIKVKILPIYSTDFLPKFAPYSYVMLDSGDHDEIVMKEINLVKDNMVSGGVIVMHDLDSQFLAVRDGYNYLLSTGNYEEIKPDWNEINNYVNENDLETNNISWHHQEMKNPNFVGALRRK